MTIRSNIDLDLAPRANEALNKWQGDHGKLVEQLKAFEQNQLGKRFDAWLAKRPKGRIPQPQWIVLDLADAKSHGGATLTKLDDGSLLASGTNPNFDKYTLVATTSIQGITAIRLEALAHPSMVKSGPGRAGNGNMGLGNFTVTAEPVNGEGKPVTIKLVNPKATFQQNTGNLSIAASIDNNPKTGWAIDPQFGKDHAAVFETEQAIGFDGGTKLTFTLEFNVNTKHNIGRARLAISTAPRPVAIQGDSLRQDVVKILAAYDKTGKLDAVQRKSLLAWYRTEDDEWRKRHDRVQNHLKSKPQPKRTKVMVSSEGLPPIKHHADGRGFPHFYKQVFFLKRGDATQKKGEAEQGFLQVLMTSKDKEKHWQVAPPNGWRTSYRRRSLANWMTDTKHGAGHLLARVAVNRLWHHHLGRGIVSTPNDFGFQGA
ncbi:MAG: DUF1553 domain-containing protein, partial [Planctomycetes bacterium]|nr:DUF1553 domain-containing protein [Planctomycetota bacterium]